MYCEPDFQIFNTLCCKDISNNFLNWMEDENGNLIPINNLSLGNEVNFIDKIYLCDGR